MNMAESFYILKEEDSHVRNDFEGWVTAERNQTIERYNSYPYSYTNTDVDSLWEAWKAAYFYYMSGIGKRK